MNDSVQSLGGMRSFVLLPAAPRPARLHTPSVRARVCFPRDLNARMVSLVLDTQAQAPPFGD